jgi:hypothetical protein
MDKKLIICIGLCLFLSISAVSAAAETLSPPPGYHSSVTSLFGTGSRGYVDGGKADAVFAMPYGVISGVNGEFIVFDTFNNAIRVIGGDEVKTITGTVSVSDNKGFPRGFYLDGEAETALFNRPAGGVITEAEPNMETNFMDAFLDDIDIKEPDKIPDDDADIKDPDDNDPNPKDEPEDEDGEPTDGEPDKDNLILDDIDTGLPPEEEDDPSGDEPETGVE